MGAYERTAGLRAAGARLIAPLAVGLAAVAFAHSLLVDLQAGYIGPDFQGTLWDTGRAIWAGHNPYPAADAGALLQAGNPAVYPPFHLLAALPFALLPFGAAIAAFDLVNTAALASALWLVGLRDWRCYALALFSVPFLGAVVMGQPDGLLALGCAVAWRGRDRRLLGPAAVAAMVAAKLYLWPLFVWLWLSGRRGQAVRAAVLTAGATVAAWAVIGFDGLTAYPSLLSADVDAFQARSHSLVAAAMRLGLPAASGLAAGAVLALTAMLWARRSVDGPTRDRRLFAAAVGAALVLTPIMWTHYLVVLFVPLALARPRLGPAWFVTLAFWLSLVEPPPQLWRLLVTLGAGLVLAGLAVAADHPGRPAAVR
jgi:alpha-1,2-mannosyltransferase